MKLQWDEGCGNDAERTISCSDQTITSYATVPDDMTMDEAAAEYMSTYDHNGVPGSVSLSLELWESYDGDADPNETAEITYSDEDIFDIIDEKTADRYGVICGNGLCIAEGDPDKNVYGDRDEARVRAHELRTYQVWDDGGCQHTLEADSVDEAAEMAREWMESQDYSDGETSGEFTVKDHAGEVVYSGTFDLEAE